jgi:putative acetyltransferase
MPKKNMPLIIRLIEKPDNGGVASLIKITMTELGIVGPGASLNDPETSSIYEAYTAPRAAYFVLCDDSRDAIVGGAGIGPLNNSDSAICELRKMYLRPEVRGFGYGKALLARCLDAARQFSYSKCYLETMNVMDRALQLYFQAGFKQLSEPLGHTGHIVDRFYMKDL